MIKTELSCKKIINKNKSKVSNTVRVVKGGSWLNTAYWLDRDKEDTKTIKIFRLGFASV